MAVPDGLKRIQNVQQSQIYLKSMPPIPDDVKKRFPSMTEYEKQLQEWLRKTVSQIQGGGL